MISHSQTITKLMGAMLRVQGAVDGVSKDATNPAFKRKYASLESVVDTIRPACQEHGLVVMQAPGAFREGVIAVETFIVHAESGEWIKSALELPLAKVDPQGAGSAITYAERYSLMALFNLPPVDDDANDASRRPEPPRAVTSRAEPSPPVNIAPNAGDLARMLADAIYTTRDGADLDALVADPDFKRQRASLPEAARTIVDSAGRRQREQFKGSAA